MAFINGIEYDENGRPVNPPEGQPQQGDIGIGGAPAGRSPYYAQLQAKKANETPHTDGYGVGFIYKKMLAEGKPDNAETMAAAQAQHRKSLAMTRGGANQYAAAKAGAARRGWTGQESVGTPASMPAGYDPNAPLGAIGGVQNDPRYQPTTSPTQDESTEGGAATLSVSQPPNSAQPVPEFNSGYQATNTNADTPTNTNTNTNTNASTNNTGDFGSIVSNQNPTSFAAGGNTFVAKKNADGTISWTRSDGQKFDNMTQADFAKYFGTDLANYYYASVTPPDITDRTINPETETVSGQLQKLLGEDSKYIQAARARSSDRMNARGLMNSTMAGQAGEAAAIDAALPIAAADAGIYGKASDYNVSTKNQFEQMRYAADIAKDARHDAASIAENFEKLKSQLNYDSNVSLKAIDHNYKQLSQYSTAATSLLQTFNTQVATILASPDIAQENKQGLIDKLTTIYNNSFAAMKAMYDNDTTPEDVTNKQWTGGDFGSLVTNTKPTSFDAGGNTFNIAKKNTDGTINWTRTDGQKFDNLTKVDFAKFFGNDLAEYYY